MYQTEIYFSIDVGNAVSGVAVLSKDSILEACNIPNDNMWNKIKEYYVKYDVFVIVEDIRPYSGKLTMQVIDTCKFIGELCYRLRKEYKLKYALVTRNEVKKWVFNAYGVVASERISKRIEYLDGYRTGRGERGLRKKDGELRSPSFHWVDDRVCIAAMKIHWNIDTPKPGKSNKHGLSKHSWQALALGTYWIKHQETISG